MLETRSRKRLEHNAQLLCTSGPGLESALAPFQEDALQDRSPEHTVPPNQRRALGDQAISRTPTRRQADEPQRRDAAQASRDRSDRRESGPTHAPLLMLDARRSRRLARADTAIAALEL